MTWPNGATYNGDFKAGLRDGYGVYIEVDGTAYRGEWK